MIWLLLIPGYLLLGILSLFRLWEMFIAVFAIESVRHAGALDPDVEQIGKALLYRGLAFDAYCNIFFASLLFLEPPREWMVTARLQRLVDGKPGWRRDIALWFAVKAMNPFCRKPHINIPKSPA